MNMQERDFTVEEVADVAMWVKENFVIEGPGRYVMLLLTNCLEVGRIDDIQVSVNGRSGFVVFTGDFVHLYSSELGGLRLKYGSRTDVWRLDMRCILDCRVKPGVIPDSVYESVMNKYEALSDEINAQARVVEQSKEYCVHEAEAEALKIIWKE